MDGPEAGAQHSPWRVVPAAAVAAGLIAAALVRRRWHVRREHVRSVASAGRAVAGRLSDVPSVEEVVGRLPGPVEVIDAARGLSDLRLVKDGAARLIDPSAVAQHLWPPGSDDAAAS